MRKYTFGEENPFSRENPDAEKVYHAFDLGKVVELSFLNHGIEYTCRMKKLTKDHIRIKQGKYFRIEGENNESIEAYIEFVNGLSNYIANMN